MGRLIREDYYFDEPGERNMDDVVEAVKERVSATGVKHVVVASTGENADQVCRSLGQGVGGKNVQNATCQEHARTS